jgi:hypothetical protein
MMDAWLNLTPVLPAAAILRAALPVFWCVVLAWLALDGLDLSRRGSKPARIWIASAVTVWTLAPSDWSLTYGLGLAFQMPSVMAVALCVATLLRRWVRPGVPHERRAGTGQASTITLLGLATVLGWLLLLDTLALLPVSLYPWGHGTIALAVMAALAALLWIWEGHTLTGVVLMAVLGVYMASRLPTGNVFDAVLDPWLWVWAQFSLLRRCWVGLAHRFAAGSTPG